MDRQHNPTNGDYTGKQEASLLPAIYRRLITPRGSWWGDSALGSRLHQITREKSLAHVGQLAVQYASEALQPLLDDKRATAINYSYQGPTNGYLQLFIECIQADGQQISVTYPVSV